VQRGPVGNARQNGSTVVEFALVAPLAVAIALAVAQFALFLFERNVVMGSLSEGARVAASSGRTVVDGERSARKLMRESLGGRLAMAVAVRGDLEGGMVVLRADGTLPSLVPGVPGLRVHLGATMHKEEELRELSPDPTAVGEDLVRVDRTAAKDPASLDRGDAVAGSGAELADPSGGPPVGGAVVTRHRVASLGQRRLDRGGEDR
jgi:hypothetical protein